MNSEFFKDKNVLVAGGAGFMGSHLILQLLETGAKVRAVDIKSAPQVKDSRVEYVQLDLTKKEDCQKAVKGMDYVFMAAANTAGAAVMEYTPLAQVTPNVVMNGFMLEASHEAGVKKFLFISSNTVYPDLDVPMKEEDMKYGDVFYKYYFVAWMKQFSEVMCQMYAKGKSPMKTIIVRPANSYGPYSGFDWETSHVIPALIRKVVERQDPVPVWGDGSDIKDFIYVEDLVRGMLLAMEKLESPDPDKLGYR
jgi:GDP-L-fucose synthase